MLFIFPFPSSRAVLLLSHQHFLQQIICYCHFPLSFNRQPILLMLAPLNLTRHFVQSSLIGSVHQPRINARFSLPTLFLCRTTFRQSDLHKGFSSVNLQSLVLAVPIPTFPCPFNQHSSFILHVPFYLFISHCCYPRPLINPHHASTSTPISHCLVAITCLFAITHVYPTILLLPLVLSPIGRLPLFHLAAHSRTSACIIVKELHFSR